MTEQGFIIWLKSELFLARPTQEIPAGLPSQVANQNAGHTSSYLLGDSAM